MIKISVIMIWMSGDHGLDVNGHDLNDRNHDLDVSSHDLDDNNDGLV